MFEEQGIKIKENKYERALEFYQKKKSRLKKEREELKEELKGKQKMADKYEITRLGGKIGEINKKLRELSDYESALRFRTDELESISITLDSALARAEKKEKSEEELVFKTDKSFLDGLAGYISKDCTKGRTEFFTEYFSKEKADNIKIFRKSGDKETWIGNIYLLHPEKNIFVLDAFQLATPTQYNTKELWQEIVKKLKDAIGKDSKLYISEFLSNYEQIRKGFNAAFPNKRKADFKLKGFDAFESSKKGFFEVN